MFPAIDHAPPILQDANHHFTKTMECAWTPVEKEMAGQKGLGSEPKLLISTMTTSTVYGHAMEISKRRACPMEITDSFQSIKLNVTVLITVQRTCNVGLSAVRLPSPELLVEHRVALAQKYNAELDLCLGALHGTSHEESTRQPGQEGLSRGKTMRLLQFSSTIQTSHLK